MDKRCIALLSAAHVFTDLNQGALPAILPFLLSDFNLTYTEAAGLIFASNFTSSLAQPLFGYFADRVSTPLFMPLGVLFAGCGLACIGFLSSYWGIFIAVVVSGIGIAAFHPVATKLANIASGNLKGTGISLFAVGGNAGFTMGPIVTAPALLFWGLKGSLIYGFLAMSMAGVLLSQITTLPVQEMYAKKRENLPNGTRHVDQWAPFSRLTMIIVCRSVIFYGLSTFLPLYLIHSFGFSKAHSEAALTIFFIIGTLGNFAGGRIADRIGNIKVVRSGFLTLWPLLAILIVTTNQIMMLILLFPVGIALFVPFSPMVVLGQQYLPNRIGFASGVTLGLAVSIEGTAVPVLGWIADSYGLSLAMSLIACLPLLAAALSFSLPTPLKPKGISAAIS